MTEKANSIDVDAIKKTIMDYYHEGHVRSDPKLYNEVLHDQWKIFYLKEDGTLSIADKAEYLSWYTPEDNDESLNWTTTLEFIDVSGQLAAVKCHIRNQHFGYIDYFNMMKIKDRWWIVHKISQRNG